MTDSSRILARQVEWQKRRLHLSWPEKVRLAEAALPTSRGWNYRSPSRNSETNTRIQRRPSK
jgi:hypothetical protein